MERSADLAGTSLVVQRLGGIFEDFQWRSLYHGVKVAVMFVDLREVGIDEAGAGDRAGSQHLLKGLDVGREQIERRLVRAKPEGRVMATQEVAERAE